MDIVALGMDLADLYLDPDELAAFVAAVESGTVTGAADALELTQSAATKRLQSLERRLGTELLERTLVFEFKGKTNMVYDPSGLRCTITIPVNHRLLPTAAGA